jgi:hypothetical protein
MITLSPASTRPIRLSVPAKRGIAVQKVDASQPAPAIRLLSGPPGTVPGPMGETSIAQATEIAEAAATQSRGDLAGLVSALLNPGL